MVTPIGRYTRSSFASYAAGAQEFGELKVNVCSSAGIALGSFAPGSKAHSSLPVLTSKPRITPDVSRVEKLSVTEPAITIVLSVIIGGEVGSYRPGVVSGILVCRFRMPLLPKVSHSLPVSALMANSRPSLTGSMMRRGQSATTSGLALSARAS
ncbi:hypothetical protein D3C72_1880320 [compost metagenome]